MKYRGVLLLALLVAVSVQTSAQDNPISKGGQESGKFQSQACPDFKIGIITPPASTDFKMQLLVPPANLDNGIISMLCGAPSQLSLGPQMLMLPGSNALSMGTSFMSGQANVFMTGQGNVITPRRIK